MSDTTSYHRKLALNANPIINLVLQTTHNDLALTKCFEYVSMLFIFRVEKHTLLKKTYSYPDLIDWVNENMDFDICDAIELGERVDSLLADCLQEVDELLDVIDFNEWGVYSVIVNNPIVILEYIGDYRILTWSHSDDALQNFAHIDTYARCSDKQDWFK